MTSFVYWIRGAEFADLAKLSIASVRKLYPFLVERKVIVYTDEASPTWIDNLAPYGSGIELRQLATGRPAMVANLDAQVDAILNAVQGEQVLFLDADTLMRRSFPWQAGIDLYATWRDHVNGDREMAQAQPWNYGVVGAVANPATIQAFIWLRARVLQMNPKNQDWYGNQLALADLLGAAKQDAWMAYVRWTLADEGTPLRVKPLPCEVWNWSPCVEGQDIEEKGVIHLKGTRKELMEHYYARM
jgi:hypothetical protein